MDARHAAAQESLSVAASDMLAAEGVWLRNVLVGYNNHPQTAVHDQSSSKGENIMGAAAVAATGHDGDNGENSKGAAAVAATGHDGDKGTETEIDRLCAARVAKMPPYHFPALPPYPRRPLRNAWEAMEKEDDDVEEGKNLKRTRSVIDDEQTPPKVKKNDAVPSSDAPLWQLHCEDLCRKMDSMQKELDQAKQRLTIVEFERDKALRAADALYRKSEEDLNGTIEEMRDSLKKIEGVIERWFSSASVFP